MDITSYERFCQNPYELADATVEVLRRLSGWTQDAAGVTLHLDAAVCQTQPVGISALMTGRSLAFTGRWAQAFLRVEPCGVGGLRLRRWHGGAMPQKDTPMLQALPAATFSLAVQEENERLVMAGGGLRVVAVKEPFCLAVYGQDGALLYSQYNDDDHNVTADRRRGYQEGEQQAEIGLSYPGFECFPCGRVTLADGRAMLCESVKMTPGERFYGFGEQFSPLDKNGREILNWVVNPVGVSSAKAYKCVPFFISGRGYGAYYNTPRFARFAMGSYYFKAYTSQVEDELLDIFLFAGAPATVLGSYTALTGRSALPPKWSFGVWMSRNCYRTRAEVEAVAARLRKEALPCDVLHIDWDYCQTRAHNFLFDTERFPDVADMAAGLRAQGMQLSLWQLPYLKHGTPVWRDALENGAVAMQRDGQPADTEAGEGIIDFSAPAGVSWYQKKLRALLEQGVRAIKTDFGENAGPDYVYQNAEGRDMHNLYPLLYNKAAFEACQQVHPGDSLVWGRSAYAGAQRYPVYWGGDSDSDFSGMYHTLRGGLSLGLSGFPFWSHDVGGYFGTPTQEVYIRWLQFGMLSPLVRFHGTSPREPWAFGQEAVAQYKKYAALRYSLMEYLYCEARHCTRDGTPMLRALVLDFPEDTLCSAMDDQYLLGRSLLVAPVFSAEGSRSVYLPAETAWVNWHTGQWHSGGRAVEVDTPIGITPVFMRGGAALPFVEPGQHVQAGGPGAIWWEVCPAQDAAAYHLVSGEVDIALQYNFDGGTGVGRLTVAGGGAVQASYRIHGPNIKKLYYNGKEQAYRYENGGVACFEAGAQEAQKVR